jgi:hypothetical protein
MIKFKIIACLLLLPIGVSLNNLRIDRINQSWETIDFRKISFKIPNPYSSTVSMANTNQYTWLTNNERISITIDIGNIPNKKQNLQINELIPNVKSFAEEVNNGNKQDFSDFKILSQEYINLGDTKALLVNQQSTKVSGKNKLYNIHSYFVTAKPHFYSIVISYEASSYSDRKIAEKIASSFRFVKEEGPSISETKKWLTSKIVDRIKPTRWTNNTFFNPVKTITYPTYFGAIKDYLIFEQKTKTSKNGKVKHERISIPLKEIYDFPNDEDANYEGECSFYIMTNLSKIIFEDLDTKEKRYGSTYEFTLDCVTEEDLAERLISAINHLKENIPDYSKPQKKETF